MHKIQNLSHDKNFTYSYLNIQREDYNKFNQTCKLIIFFDLYNCTMYIDVKFFFFFIHQKSEIRTFNTSIFRLYNINIIFSTCPLKYKWKLYTKKRFLNASFQDF